MSGSGPNTGTAAIGPSLRSIALPIEHGGWGFTLEPVLLGLLVAPSPAAWELGVAAVAVFLSRRPVRLLLADIVRRRWLSRSRIAALFATGFGVVAVAGLTGALVTADRRFLSAYLLATPPALVALYADSQTKSRTLAAEMAGAIAMGATVSAIALADGWGYFEALGLWVVLIARAVTTISLVRAQIRRVHGRPARAGLVYSVVVATLAAMVVLATVAMVPWLSVAAIGGIGILTRVSLTRSPVSARVVGWTQIVTGLVVVILTACGVWLSW